jgi:hypothetical protein
MAQGWDAIDQFIWGKLRGFLSVIVFAPNGRRLLESGWALCAADAPGWPVDVRVGRGESGEARGFGVLREPTAVEELW